MGRPQNIALVHDWLTGMRGGEKVLECFCELFPDATLFTLVHHHGSCSPVIERMKIRTSVLQRLPLGRSHYRQFLPFYPMIVKSLDVRGFDIVISSSHAAAKSVRVRDGALHICYCHTPMRYIWDQYDHYFGKGRASLPVRLAMKVVRPYLQRWDIRTANGVHHFIANSEFVRERIRRIYGRDSIVIHPPVESEKCPLSIGNEGYYLVVSALVPYKRIDLAIEAFNGLGSRLIVVGTGPEERKLKAMARENIEFIGWASDARLGTLYAGCRALVFPGEEDFGIVPVEAMACGKPVIAFGKGGARETVIDRTTGLLFMEQSSRSLERCVADFERLEFNPQQIHEHAATFDKKEFMEQLRRTLSEMMGARAFRE